MSAVSTVLVVDDEPIVRDVVVRYLEREGYRTLETGDDVADDWFVVDDEHRAHGTHCGPRMASTAFQPCSETRHLRARDDVDAGSVPDLQEEPHAQETLALSLASITALVVSLAALAAGSGGVTGPAIYVDGVLYRTVGTPTDLSHTGAPASSFETLYDLGGCSRTTWRSQLPGDPGFKGGAGPSTRSPSSTTPTPSPPTT